MFSFNEIGDRTLQAGWSDDEIGWQWPTPDLQAWACEGSVSVVIYSGKKMKKKIKIRKRATPNVPHPQLTSGWWKNQGTIAPARARDPNKSGHTVFELYRFWGFHASSSVFRDICGGMTSTTGTPPHIHAL